MFINGSEVEVYSRTEKTSPHELENRFSYHAPHDDQQLRYEEIRRNICVLANLICDLTPSSPEQSLSLNALDQVMFLANAAIARRSCE